MGQNHSWPELIIKPDIIQRVEHIHIHCVSGLQKKTELLRMKQCCTCCEARKPPPGSSEAGMVVLKGLRETRLAQAGSSHTPPQPVLTWSSGFWWSWRGASLYLV